MSLRGVITGKLVKPVRVLLHGTEGVGKSTFGSCAPKPIFLCAENGTNQLDVARFPPVTCWEDGLEAVDVLQTEPHDYQTLVVDSVDWLEPFVWEHVVRNATSDKMGRKPKNISEVGGGFNKGYDVALDQWRIFLDRLEKLQAARDMHVILLAHTEIKNFQNPEGENFDRYQMRLHHKAAGKLIQWADAVLFAAFDMGVTKEGHKAIGISTGARVMRTERRAAFDAKNRYGLPFRMPLSWDEFWAGVESGQPASPQKMIAEARDLGQQAGVSDKVEAAIVRANGDATKLAQLVDWVRGKVQIATEEAAVDQGQATDAGAETQGTDQETAAA